MSGARVYVRPVGLAESPQTYDGATIRLGHSLVWCHLLALESYDGATLVARQIEVDVLQIVGARAADADEFHRCSAWGLGREKLYAKPPIKAMY